jgi:hypothetical protein
VNPVELIHHLVARTGESQKNLALAWLEAWNATAARPLAIATSQPRFSNLMKDEMDGWKFFFGDPRRGDVLLGVLRADDAERQLLVEGAAAKLASHADARVVVDLHDLDGRVDAILNALVRDVLTDRRLVPVVVLVSPTQYGQIPMAFADQVRLIQVANDNEATREMAQRAAALVLSAQPPRDPDTGAPACSRWAAIAWDKARLSVEPVDAIAAFGEAGRLPDLPLVEPAHRLDRLGVAPSPLAKPLSGPELRRRMLALAAGALDVPAGERLGEANTYGIVAASTDGERVRAALSASGFPPEEGVDPAGLERALVRAALRPGAPLVLRVGSDWHLLNTEAPEALRGHDRVVAHRFDARPTPLRRLAEAITSRSAVDWELDPYLHSAVAALDPGGQERPALNHARAWLVYGGHCHIGRNVRVPDGLSLLSRLLAGPAPVAEVRLTQVPTKTSSPIAPRVYSLPDPSVLERDVWAQVPGVGEVQWHRRENRLVLASVGEARRMGDLLNDRHRAPLSPTLKSPWEGAVWEGHLLVPSGAALDDDAWLDAMEARGADSPMQRLRDRHRAGAEEERAARLRHAELEEASEARRFSRRPGAVSLPHRHDGRNDGDNALRTSLKVFDLPAAPWSDLDAALVMAWSALGRAARSAHPLQVHDGRSLLPVAPGLLAELTFIAAPSWMPCRAAFVQQTECGWEVNQYGRVGWTWTTVTENSRISRPLSAAFSPLFAPVFGWEASGGTRVGPSLPVGLHIVGEGISCAIRFAADPYGLHDSGSRAEPMSLRADVLAAVEAARVSNE